MGRLRVGFRAIREGEIPGGVLGLSIEARYLAPENPPELDATYRRTFNRLKGLFRARGCTPEEAADLAQEAAMRAYMHVQRWGVTGDGLDPLINRIARNLLIDRHRRVAPHLVPLENAAEVRDPALDPTDEIIRRQRSHEVRSAVQELPDRHQTAILYSMKGMTPAEVGDQLGIGRNAADALLHRARRSLRERLRHVGEGAFGFGLWFRIKTRNAAGKVGLGSPLEAAGATSIPASVAAAAAFVAAINIFSGPADSPQMRPTPRIAAVAPVGSLQDSAMPQNAIAGSSIVSAAKPARIDAGAGSAEADRKGVKTDTGVPNPVRPDQRLLGVGPDVEVEEDEGTVNHATSRACAARQQTCAELYESPIDDNPGGRKATR